MERRGSHRRSARSLATRPFTPGFPSSGSDAACAAEELTAAVYSGSGRESGGGGFVWKRAHVSMRRPPQGV